eukprot:jgi/Tetstr1/454341/TSEL_004019.t1
MGETPAHGIEAAVAGLVRRAELQYARRFTEGEAVAQDDGLREEMGAVAREADALPAGGGPGVRGRAAYAAGLAAAMLTGFGSAAARQQLQRAVKLDPACAGAWNCLGHCLWAGGPPEAALALACFERGLQARPGNKEGLRQRGVLRRQMATAAASEGGEGGDNSAELAASIQDAKAAVQQDVSDGYSWYLLGTAHLMAGAGRLDGPAMLQALAAYQQAEKLGIAIPDLFFNRGILQRHLQRYGPALEDMRRAQALDPELPCAAQIQSLGAILAILQRGVQSVEGLPRSKLSAAASALAAAALPGDALAELTPGRNEGRALACRVMRVLHGGPPVHFVGMDAGGRLGAVAVAGLAEGVLLEGHNLLISAPELEALEHVDPNSGKASCITLVRVTEPSRMTLNGTEALPSEPAALQVRASYGA